MSTEDIGILFSEEKLFDKPTEEDICEYSPSSAHTSQKNVDCYKIKTPPGNWHYFPPISYQTHPVFDTKSPPPDTQTEEVGEYLDTVNSLSTVNCCVNLNPTFNGVAETHEKRKDSVVSEISCKTADTAEPKTLSKFNSGAVSKDSLAQEEEKQFEEINGNDESTPEKESDQKEETDRTEETDQKEETVTTQEEQQPQQLPDLVSNLQSIVNNSFMRRELKVERYNSLQQQSISLMNTKVYSFVLILEF